MEAAKILHADMLDILFEGRNKDYGAYHLRKTYNKRITLALGITAGIAASLFIYFIVAQSFESDRIAAIESRELVIEDIKPEKEEKKVESPAPRPLIKQELPKVEMTRFTPPKIVDDKDVNKEDMPPEVTDLVDTKIDVANQAGAKDIGLATPPVVDEGKMVVEAPKPAEDNSIWTSVEIEASFEGGLDAWARFLRKNLNSNAPIDNGAPAGSYTVIVQFIVDKQGNISDVKALTNHGYGMEEEAIRAIKRGPKWTPAIQNGRNVNAYRKQPITFVVPEE
jgi:protein TonB